MTNDNPVDVSVEELQSQAMLDKQAIATLKAQVDELAKSLKRSNDLIEGDVKSKLIAEVEPMTDFKLVELIGMDTERLRQIRDDSTRYTPKRSLTHGVDMSELASDKFAPLRSVYGKYRGMKS